MQQAPEIKPRLFALSTFAARRDPSHLSRPLPNLRQRHKMTRHATDGGILIRTVPISAVRLDRKELRAVERVLKSGRLRAGRVVEDFEVRFARAVGAKFAVAVSSGTAALFLAYRVLLEPGDEIIVPDFTFAATASMAVAAGLRPVFADVDPATFTLDPGQVERRITRKTRAIAPVHLYGHPADVSALLRLARRHDLRVIWDAAQAHGAAFRGRDVGSFPGAVCYSFYPSKNMTTGEGGMITTSNASLAAEFRLLRSHGEESRYHHIRLGFNFRLTDFAAALGREQLRKLPSEVRARRRNAATLARGLAGLPGLEVPGVAPGTTHAFNLFTLRLDPRVLRMSRDDFQRALARRGIETAVHYPAPLHWQPIFRGYGTDRDFPVSAHLAKTVLSLPVHPGLNQRDLDRIIRAVRQLCGVASRKPGSK
jgi:perosamine synthetase